MAPVSRRQFIAGSACTASLIPMDIASGSPAQETSVRWKTRLTETEARYGGATAFENGDIVVSATIHPQEEPSTRQIIRVTADGEIRWRWSTPQELEGAHIGDITSLGDGTVVTPFWDGSTISLVNIDGAGLTNWTYEHTSENYVGNLQTASDSGRVYVIGTSSGIHDPVTLVYAVNTANGEPIWKKVFKDHYGPTVIQNTESGCIAGGKTISEGAWLAKFSNTGSIQWKRQFDSAALKGVTAVLNEPESTVVVGDSGQKTEMLQYRLVSLDEEGKTQRSRSITTDYDANEYDDIEAASLVRHPDSGYVVVESYDRSFFVIRNVSLDGGTVSTVTMDRDVDTNPKDMFDTDDGYRLAGWSGHREDEYLWAMRFDESLLSKGAGETAGTDEVARSTTETDLTAEPSSSPSRTPVTDATTEATTADGPGFGVVAGLSAAVIALLAGRGREKSSE